MIGRSIATQLALRTGPYDVALLTAGMIAGIAAVTTLITCATASLNLTRDVAGVESCRSSARLRDRGFCTLLMA